RHLALGHPLEEEARPPPLGVLDGGAGAALLLGHADPLEELVPGGERVGALGQLDAGRPGVDVAEHLPPEGGEGGRVVAVEGDLDLAAHRPDGGTRPWPSRPRARAAARLIVSTGRRRTRRPGGGAAPTRPRAGPAP